VLGTHTSGQEDNYLIIAKIRLPIIENLLEMKAGYITQMEENDKNFQNLGVLKPDLQKIEIQQKILHSGEINRARHNPLE